MCCLFGVLDLEHHFTGKQRAKLIRCLSIASEVRGTDATGIAYNAGGKLHVYKRPVPAHRFRFHIPESTRIVMGHVRLTTQGSEQHNYNNHPFRAKAGGQSFALAHNGVLYNDDVLRQTRNLPRTNIETDSFVAVQILEKQGKISFSSLGRMAEQMEGSFSFTVLDGQDNLYFVKGDNPLCIYHYPKIGLYLYASTEAILLDALSRIPFKLGKPKQVVLDCGEILKIDSHGCQTRSQFDDRNLFRRWYSPCSFMFDPTAKKRSVPAQMSMEREYVTALKSVASFYGYDPNFVDALLADGFATDDIEEMLYCGEL